MANGTTRKVGSTIVALALLGAVLAPAMPAQAQDDVSAGSQGEAPCITVYHDPPDVTISPRDCKPSRVLNETSGAIIP